MTGDRTTDGETLLPVATGEPIGMTTTAARDSDDDWDVNEEHLAKLVEKYKGEEFPLFMDEIPHNIEGNAHLEALQSILYSDQTPEERAASFREQGNEHFSDAAASAHKTQRYIDAIHCYTEGIKQNCSDQKLNSILYANRGHVHLLLGHYVECVNDCRKSIDADPSNVKAYYRAAKASYYLQLFAQSVQFCQEGLKQDAENAMLQSLLRQATERLEARRKAVVKEKNVSSHQELLEQALQERGLTVTRQCPYETSMLHISETLRVNPDDHRLHWPCLVLYPEVNVSEVILDFDEATCLDDHLAVMFPGDQFAPWDTTHTYVHDKLAVYFEPGLPNDCFIKIPRDVPLKTILSNIGHLAQIPIFHVMVEFQICYVQKRTAG